MDQQYTPPKIWTPDASTEGKFSGINKPTAGARFDKELPQGDHPFQLYSMATPNGVKVTILFEELLELGINEAEYDAFPINILEGSQFGSGFVTINPNSKIPALLDKNQGQPIRLFESGSILLYLAEKFEQFLPKDIQRRTEVLNWLFWQMGSAPYVGGGFGHFYAYAPEKFKYSIDRFTMETKRQLDLLNSQLADQDYIAGAEYSIADMAIFPWYGALVTGEVYDAAEFLAASEYTNVLSWVERVSKRPAVQRGRLVNRTWGDEDQQVPERHSSADFDRKKLAF